MLQFEDGVVRFSLKNVKLSPVEQRIFGALFRKLGKKVSSEELCTAVWDDGGPEMELSNLYVHITHIRSKLRLFPLTIYNYRNHYALIAEI